MAMRDNDPEMADESAESNEQLGGAIDMLKADHQAEEAFNAKFREPMANVEHHVQEKESEMFPEAEELLAD